MTKIRFRDHALFDTDTLELTLFNKRIRLKPVDSITPKYLEPFVGVEEPEAWLCIDRRKVVVKVGDKFFTGTIE